MIYNIQKIYFLNMMYEWQHDFISVMTELELGWRLPPAPCPTCLKSSTCHNTWLESGLPCILGLPLLMH